MTSSFAKKPIEPRRYVRNGRVPDARFAFNLAEDANALSKFRLKELARFTQPIASLLGKGGPSRVRWRFACHTSPYATAIVVRAWMAPAEATASYTPRTEISLVDGSATDYGTATVHCPIVVGTPIDVPSNFADAKAFVMSAPGVIQAIPGNTALYGTVTDIEDGRIAALTVYEVAYQQPSPLDEGYALGTPIEDADRAATVTLLRNAWKQQGAPLVTWSVDSSASARTRTSATSINAIDNTSTAVSAATPGWTIDLRNASTLRRTTVPCVFKIYGSAAGAAGGPVTVALKDSTGSTVANVTFVDTVGWYSTTCDLPATEQKLDLHYAGDGVELLTLYAVSLYQYEA